jgi:hypothetical protein
VAKIDRQRLNEFVANGDYTCAPETTPGRSRLFEEMDLIALFIFAREMERGIKPSIAGQLASKVREALAQQPKAGIVTIGNPLNTAQLITVQKSIWRIAGEGPLLSLTSYNVDCVRTAIRQGVKEERQIVGPEDDS